ncbi:MAG: hypothetical protein J6B23_06495, partial [Clostridia bacterium]|nr:hypothetical protein [Clostridia bacterium]
IVPGVQLELGKWYDIKVAANFADENASSGVPAYVWVNDELVANGTVISSVVPGTGWVYNKLYFDQAENENSVAYIDDIKVYETAQLGEIIVPEEPNPDEPGNTPEITNSYFDIDFENWTEWGDNNFNGAKNSDGSEISHEWGANPWYMASATDSGRTGKVMRAAIPTSGGSNYFLRSRMKVANLPSDYTNVDVLWNEFSIKYEGGFIGFGTNENDHAYSIISVNKNGQLALGARWGYNEVGSEGNFNAGTIIHGVQLELGKWYDIKVAANFADENASSGVPAYVWVNDELVANGTVISSVVPGTGWVYNKLYFDQAENENSIAYIDDIKVYETAELGLAVPEKINVMREALNSIEASIRPRNDEYNAETKMVDGNKSEDSLYKSIKTRAEADGLKVIAALNAVYSISSATVTERYIDDHGLTVTVEIGKAGELTTVVDNQPVNNGKGEYTFNATEGDTIVYTFKVAEQRWNEDNRDSAESDYQICELEAFGTYVEDVAQSGFAPKIGFWYNDWNGQVEDVISYYITCYNVGDEEITGDFIVAAYDGNKLVKVAAVKDNPEDKNVLKKGANVVSCMEKQNFYDASLTYKAFFWDGAGTMVPVVKATDIIK